MRNIVEIVGKIPCNKGGFIYHAYEPINAYGILTKTFYCEQDLNIGAFVEILTIQNKSYFIKEILK